MAEIDNQKLLGAQRSAWSAYSCAQQALIHAEAFGAHPSVITSIERAAAYAWATLTEIVNS